MSHNHLNFSVIADTDPQAQILWGAVVSTPQTFGDELASAIYEAIASAAQQIVSPLVTATPKWYRFVLDEQLAAGDTWKAQFEARMTTGTATFHVRLLDADDNIVGSDTQLITTTLTAYDLNIPVTGIALYADVAFTT
jgi:hypothetical protein